MFNSSSLGRVARYGIFCFPLLVDRIGIKGEVEGILVF